MGILDYVWRKFDEYCETDEIIDNIIRRDYFYITYTSGLYANFKGRYRILSVVLFILYTCSSLYHLYVLAGTLFALGKLNFTLSTFLFQMFMLIQFCLFVLFVFSWKRQDFRKLNREMVGEFFTYPGEDHKEILGRLHKNIWTEKKRILVLPLTLSFIGTFAVVLGPLLDSKYGDPGFNTTSVGLFTDTPISAVYPFHISEEDREFYFYFLSLLQILTAVFVCSLIGSAILFFMNTTYGLILHIQYLIETVRCLPARALGHYSSARASHSLCQGHLGIGDERIYGEKEFDRSFETCLKKNFAHHQRILKHFKELQSLFSLLIGYAYSTGTIVIALSLLSVKTGTSLPGTALTSLMACVCEICIMAMISFLGQRMTDLCEELREAVYDLKWYLCRPSVASDLAIFLEMALRPVELKGFGIVTCNLDTFSNVLNSAYSYYNLLMAI